MWRLHRQVGWLLALEDAVHVAGAAAILVNDVGSIGDQAAGRREVANRVDRGQPVPGRQRGDHVAMALRRIYATAVPPISVMKSRRFS